MNLCLQAEIETDGGRMYGPQGGGEWDEVRGWDCRVYTATFKTDSPWEPVHHRGIIIGINLSIESAQCSWRPKRDGNPKKRGHVSHRADLLCCAVETNAALSSKYTPIKKKTTLWPRDLIETGVTYLRAIRLSSEGQQGLNAPLLLFSVDSLLLKWSEFLISVTLTIKATRQLGFRLPRKYSITFLTFFWSLY